MWSSMPLTEIRHPKDVKNINLYVPSVRELLTIFDLTAVLCESQNDA